MERFKKYNIKSSNNDMRTQKIRTVTDDRLVMDGLLYKSENKSDTIVINIHGTAGNFYANDFIKAMASGYTDQSIDFMPVNNRGHDFIAEIKRAGKLKSKTIGYAYENFEDCIHDIKAWINFAAELKYKNIILQGHSLGAVKCVYYLHKIKDKRVNGLILASPPDIVGLILKRKKPVKLTGNLLLMNSSDSLQIVSKRTMEQLRRENGPADIFSTYSPDKKSVLGEIDIPIFAFFGDVNEATTMNSEKALEILHEKAERCNDFTYKVFRGANHVYLNKEKRVAAELAKWITSRYQ